MRGNEANLSQLGAATEKYHRRACREAHDGLSSTVDDQRVSTSAHISNILPVAAGAWCMVILFLSLYNSRHVLVAAAARND